MYGYLGTGMCMYTNILEKTNLLMLMGISAPSVWACLTGSLKQTFPPQQVKGVRLVVVIRGLVFIFYCVD